MGTAADRCPQCAPLPVDATCGPAAGADEVADVLEILEETGPPPPDSKQVIAFAKAARPPGTAFRFACPVCSVTLEAGDNDCGLATTCPTCGQNFPIPAYNTRTRQVQFDPVRTPKRPMESMAYLHAYAAAGAAAPRIAHAPGGERLIVCSRCGGANPPSANWCMQCRMPFAIESGAASFAAPGAGAGGLEVATLLIGILGLPMLCGGTMFDSDVAGMFGAAAAAVGVITGILALMRSGSGRISGMAWCGLLLCLAALAWWGLRMLA